jgi:hypothetical protein
LLFNETNKQTTRYGKDEWVSEYDIGHNEEEGYCLLGM